MKYVNVCKRCKGEGNIMGACMMIYCPECCGNRFVVDDDKSLVKGLADQLALTLKQLSLANERLEKAGLLVSGTEAYGRKGDGLGNFTGD